MSRLSDVRPWLLAAGFALCAPALPAAALPKPGGVSVSEEALIAWEAVEGAGAYRVAVFDEPDAEGKRPLLAAVWVSGTRWQYGKGPVLGTVGKLPSTKPQPLPRGRTLRVMVAAALADGADKSEWAGEDFTLAEAAAEPTPAPTPSPTPGEPEVESVSPTAEADAELELEGGEEFKSSPEPAVLEVNDAAVGAAGAAGAAGAVGAAGIKAAVPIDGAPAGGTPASAASARKLLEGGQAEAAEAQYRELIKKDGTDAELWEGLGDALLARKLKAEAHEAYSQALMLDGERQHLRDWIRKNVPRR